MILFSNGTKWAFKIDYSSQICGDAKVKKEAIIRGNKRIWMALLHSCCSYAREEQMCHQQAQKALARGHETPI